jgi:hypothetical protein
MGYGLDKREFDFWEELGIFLLATVSKPLLVSTQPPMERVPGTLPWGKA